jgi:hypothetical protein
MRNYQCVSLCNEMRGAPLVHVSRIRSPALKFQARALSLATLSKFLTSRSLSLYCHPRNCRTAAATCCRRSRPLSMLLFCPRSTPPRPHPRSVSSPSSSSSSWSLSCYHHRPHLRLPRSMPPPSTSTLASSEHAATIVLDPDLPRCQALTCLCQFECE